MWCKYAEPGKDLTTCRKLSDYCGWAMAVTPLQCQYCDGKVLLATVAEIETIVKIANESKDRTMHLDLKLLTAYLTDEMRESEPVDRRPQMRVWARESLASALLAKTLSVERKAGALTAYGTLAVYDCTRLMRADIEAQTAEVPRG